MPTLYLAEVTQLRIEAVDSVIFKNKLTNKHHTSSSHADVRRSISTKFCMIIEVVRAIISPTNVFGSHQ